MANFVTSTSFITIDPTKVTSKTANASFPVTNVVDYTHPGRLYKATTCSKDATNGDWIKIDLVSTYNVYAIVIDNTNITSIKIFGHSTDLGNTIGDWSGGSPAYTATVTIPQDPLDGRYKVYIAPEQTLRWWLIACNDNTPESGTGSVWYVGGVSFFNAITTWTTNAEFPYEVTVDEGAAGAEEQPGGGYEPVTLGPSYALITLTQSKFPTSVWTEIAALTRLPKATPIMFYRNYGDAAEVYICRKRAAVTQSLIGPAVFQLRSLQLRELV